MSLRRSRQLWPRRKASSHKPARVFRPEPLEDRITPAFTAGFAAGVLTVDVTGNDRIDIQAISLGNSDGDGVPGNRDLIAIAGQSSGGFRIVPGGTSILGNTLITDVSLLRVFADRDDQAKVINVRDPSFSWNFDVEVRTGGGNDATEIDTRGKSRVEGGAGNDKITSIGPGADARDTLIGGPGIDVILGGDGDDVIEGGEDPDVLNGQLGNDVIRGGPGLDHLDDGLFFDRSGTRRRNSVGDDSLDGGDGADHLTVGGDDDAPGNDTALGGAGEDFFLILSGTSRLEGGHGNDDYMFTDSGRANDPREYSIFELGDGICVDQDDLDFAVFFDTPFTDNLDLTSTARQTVRPLSSEPDLVFGITLNTPFAVERLLKPGVDPIINPNCLLIGPDLLIRKGGDRQDSFLGDNIRTTAPDDRQRIGSVSIDGRKVSYEMRLQNDSQEPARFRLQASGLDSAEINGLTQEFFLIDGVNETRITDAMAAGFETPTALQQGQFLTIRAEVALSGTLVTGTKVRSVVKAFNATGDTNTVKDLVEFDTTFGLVVNTSDDRRDLNPLDFLDVAPEIPGDQVSLRAAIDVINLGLGNGEIRFDIPAKDFKPINVLQSNGGGLTVTRPVAILGQTQPVSERVEINLSGVTDGDAFVIDANLVKVQGLLLTGSKRHGLIVKKPGNQIGGAQPEEGNVISGNTLAGIKLESSLNVLRNNRIGTDPDGISAFPNAEGILDEAGGNFIGFEGVGNLISGNLGAGVHLVTPLVTTISHNRIGTDAGALFPVQNGTGILVNQGKGPVISNNLISGNDGAAILIRSGDSPTGPAEIDGSLITDNIIGTSADRIRPISNSVGIILERGATNTRIGQRDERSGTLSHGNFISVNSLEGIQVINASKTSIFANTIAENDVGIRLEGASDTLIQGNTITDQEESGSARIGIEVGKGVERLTIGGVASPIAFAPVLPVGPGNHFNALLTGIFVAGGTGGGAGTEPVRMPTILSNKIVTGGESFRIGNVVDRPEAPALGQVVKSKASLLIRGSVAAPAVPDRLTILLQFFAHDPNAGGQGPNASRFLGQDILRDVNPNAVKSFESRLAATLNGSEMVTATATILSPLPNRSSILSAPREAEPGVDSDNDGVIDQLEGTLDANADGIADSLQDHVASFVPDPGSTDSRAFALVTKPSTPFVAADLFSNAELELPPRVRPISGIVDFTLRTDADNSAQVQATFPRGTANRYVKLTRDPATGKHAIKRLTNGDIDFFDFERASQTGTVIDVATNPLEVAITLLFSDGLRGDELKTGEFDGLVLDPGIFVAVPETDVELKLSAPPRANVGETVVFTFDVSNKGSELSDNLRIALVLPADVSFVGGGVFDAATRRVLIDVGDLAGGAATQRSLVVKPAGRGEFGLAAEVTIGGVALDTIPINNKANSNVVSVIEATPLPPRSAISAQKQNRRLLITGSDDRDQSRITLRRSTILVTPLEGSLINGGTLALEFVGVGSIDVNLLGGADTVELVGAGFRGPITLRGGPGNDVFRLGARGARTRIIDPDGRNRVGSSLTSQGKRLDLPADEPRSLDATGNVLDFRSRFRDLFGSASRNVLRGRREARPR